MTGKINIEQRGAELHVSFPISLKDDFKTTFRTAKWNSFSKTWSVTTRSRKKLEAWIAAVEESGALISAEDFDAIELADREHEELVERINRLKRDLDAKNSEADDLADLRERNAKMLQHIENMKSEISAAAAKNTDERSAAASEKKKIEDVVASIIDLAAVKSAIAKMLKEAKFGGTQRGREIFNENKEIVSDALSALEDAGITSETMTDLSYANYNRSSKDISEWSKPVVFTPLECDDKAA